MDKETRADKGSRAHPAPGRVRGVDRCGREQGELVIISRIGPAVIRPIIDTWKRLVAAEMTLKN